MLETAMSEVTRILHEIDGGDPAAAEQLLPLVYDELRKLAAARMAQESPDHTLQATALVHEAYVRLVDARDVQRWNSRGHFFAAAAEAMRRILLNRARDKGRLKRGGRRIRQSLEHVQVVTDAPDESLADLDDCIERLAAEHPECARIVKLRFFAGLTLDDAASACGVSASTAKRHWTFARAWLFDALADDHDGTLP
jgi:RNA polymerase sigma factor (TIGR02999 family)